MIKDCFKCCAISMIAGIIVGGVLVVSNKKIENGFKKSAEFATEKIEELKDVIEEKTKKSTKQSKQ